MISLNNTAVFIATPTDLSNPGLIANIKLICKDNNLFGKFFTVPRMEQNKIYILCHFQNDTDKTNFLNLLDSEISAYLDNSITEQEFTQLT